MASTAPFSRRKTRTVHVGPVPMGGDHPVSVQSMTTTYTRQSRATLAQIGRLADAGCDIVRVAVPAPPDAAALSKIAAASPLPVVADIHFTTGLALKALEAGVAKIRLNPGNIDDPDGLRRVLALAAEREVPIRLGVNSGSVRPVRGEGGGAGSGAGGGEDLAGLMVEVLADWIETAEAEGFRDLVLSAKASDVPTTIAASRRLAEVTDLPLHLGITAAGPMEEARTRSGIVLGTLLAEGIGDTIRVSLTGDPVEEVRIGREILAELGLAPRGGVRIISCPTCGRCRVDLVRLTEEVKRRTADIRAPLTVAVMGCIVNGPGEAREADVGIAAARGRGVLFRHGRPLSELKEADLLEALLDEIRSLAESRPRQFDWPRT